MLMRTELIRTAPSDEFDRITEGLRGGYRMQQIPVDAYRRGNEFKAHLDLPGVDPGSIELTVERDVLTVRAMRSWSRADGDQVEVAERAQGEFGRQLFLGKWVDHDDITATYEDGVLTITLPVAEEAKPRRIEVVHEAGVMQATEAALAAAP
jgi:HSP20 family protein